VSEQSPTAADFLARIAVLEALVAERDGQLRDALAQRITDQLRIEKLQIEIDRLKRKTFGRSSEKLDQLLLELEDLEADIGAGDVALERPAPEPRERKSGTRKLSPALERKRVVREPECSGCPDCGGALRPMGKDSDELLDVVAQAWRVIETIRPKYSCRACDKIVQAPALPRAIARGKLSYGALAHIMMAKWGYHLPFYRQERMMAAKNADIERSTLARSAGYGSALLDPIYTRLRDWAAPAPSSTPTIRACPSRSASQAASEAPLTRARFGFTSPTIATQARMSRRSPGSAPQWAGPARAS